MDLCVCCGAYTAEGSMICVECQRKLKEENHSKKIDGEQVEIIITERKNKTPGTT